MSAYDLGTSGNNFTKLFHVTCRGAGVTTMGSTPTKFGTAKTSKIFLDF